MKASTSKFKTSSGHLNLAREFFVVAREFFIVAGEVSDLLCLKNTLSGQRRTRAFKAHTARAYPGFNSMKHLEYYYSPLDGMLVHRRVTPSITLPVPVYTQQHSASTRA